MSSFRVNVVHKPVLGPEEVLSLFAMDARLRYLPVEWKRIKLTDQLFYCPSFDGCRKAIEYLMPKRPKYLEHKFDCENMSGWLRHKVADVFQVNNFAEVEGYADCRGLGMERHGWTVFTEGIYFYQLETQTGVVMDIDDPLYVPDEIVMG